MIAGIILIWGGWKFERWVNWKLSYGNKVEQRIETLEKRVINIEESLKDGR